MKKRGIDVSHHNGWVDWQRAARDGVEFAILKIGNGSRKNTPSVDTRFEENARGALEAGIPIGGYVASYAMEPAHAAGEAAFFGQLLKAYKEKFSFPIFYDMEGEGKGGFYDQWPLGREMVSDICETFCAAMTQAGWPCGIYVNENWRKNRIREDLQRRYPLWLAHYGVSKPTYTGPIHLWQQSSAGRVDGILGKVDVNYVMSEQPVAGIVATEQAKPRILRQGVAGADVLELAKDLEAVGHLGTLGFDANLKAQVMAYQAARGLRADGEVGPLTRAALEADRVREQRIGA